MEICAKNIAHDILIMKKSYIYPNGVTKIIIRMYMHVSMGYHIKLLSKHFLASAKALCFGGLSVKLGDSVYHHRKMI